jgi:hypothetical protein
MTELPRSLVPTFFVPLFVQLHLLSLSRVDELARGAAADGIRPDGEGPSLERPFGANP